MLIDSVDSFLVRVSLFLVGKLYAFKECFSWKKPTGILLLAYRMGLDGDFPAVLCLFVAEKSFSAVLFATEKTTFFCVHSEDVLKIADKQRLLIGSFD